MGKVCALLIVLVSCFAGCRSSKTFPETKDVGQLESRLRDPDANVRARAALELAQLGTDAAKALPSLIEALRSDDLAIRQNAAVTIGKIGPAAREAIPELLKALTDPEWTIRRNAVTALGEIGDPETREAVDKLLADPDSLVRKAAAESSRKLRGK